MSQFSMRDVRSAWIACGLCLCAGCAAPQQGALDLEPKPVDVFHSPASPVTVLIFISDDCPIANRYIPELKKLRDRFTPRGASFWLVHSDPSESAADIRAHAREYQLDFREIRDPHQRFARLAKAEMTPTAAVFCPGQTLVYHGRIDDRFVELGRERPQAMQHDLANALEAVLQHRHVAVPVTKPVGCYIPTAR